MTMLQFWPRQSHHLLEIGKRTLSAGELFRAAEEDVERLLGCDDIRLPDGSAKALSRSKGARDGDLLDGQKDEGPELTEPDGEVAEEKGGAAKSGA